VVALSLHTQSLRLLLCFLYQHSVLIFHRDESRYVGSIQQPTAVDYRFKKDNSTQCATREEVVATYVRDLTHGFEESVQLHQPSAVTLSNTKGKSRWVVITGATGGLGAHLVAEAAILPDVERVVCLNRRNKQDALERQILGLRKKGIELTPNQLAKLDVHETDLTQLQLGLSAEVYNSLAANVTHIIHNAWLMHSKWAVKRFQPQLHIMSQMLNLARDISLRHISSDPVSFLFISSIATVGYHPYLANSPTVPEERMPIASVLPTGYGEAKYICERMLDATLHQHPRHFRAAAIRLGQIAGSSLNGHWNSMEHVSFMMKSSQTLRALPDLPGTMGWTPADMIAKTVLEIGMQPNPVRLHPIYHIDNPVRQPWSDVLAVLANALDIPCDGSGIVPFDEWLKRVRDWPRAEDNGSEGKNPAYLLVDFLEEHFVRMSCGGLLMGTRKAREHSETLAKMGIVSDELIRLYVQSWKDMGFLTR
jgi:thioester reductase-like protein